MRVRLLVFALLLSACSSAADAQERIVRSSVREYVVQGSARNVQSSAPRVRTARANSVAQAPAAVGAPQYDGAQYDGAYYAGASYDGAVSPQSWHRGYYYTAWGKPVPLVVPPTANFQTHWGWGIGNTRVTRIDPQFAGPMNGYPYDGAEGFRPTPHWPWDTDQFGVYYIRGPW